MARIFEVTTIAGRLQSYEIIEVSPTTYANGSPGVGINHPTMKGGSAMDELASHAYCAYYSTGLDEAIGQYPPSLHDGEGMAYVELAPPERLRMIYDLLPTSASVPILRIYPTEGRIYVAEYDFKKAKRPLERMSVGQERGGGLHLGFAGLQVFLHLRNSEKEQEFYYGRDLKRSEIRKD